MSLLYFSQTPGAYVVYGLSTDTKPLSPADDSFFVEIDTGNFYKASGSLWQLPTNKKNIVSLIDFPSPSAGVITLEDYTTYVINGLVDIGNNRLVCGIKTTLVGIDKNNDILSSTTTGALLTVDSSSVNKVSLTLNTLTVNCVNGSVFNITKPSLGNVVILNNCNFTTITSMGSVHNCASFVMRYCAFLTVSSSGLTFTGANSVFQIRDSQFRTVTGTCFNLGAATFTTCEVSRCYVTMASGEIFLSGTSNGNNVSVGGLISQNIFSGAGTFIQTIQESDPKWLFCNNIGIANTIIENSPSVAVVSTATYNETTTEGDSILLADCTSNNVLINLPTAIGNTSKISVKRIVGGGNTVTINGFGSETIDGGLTALLNVQYESITLVSDNGNWQII